MKTARAFQRRLAAREEDKLYLYRLARGIQWDPVRAEPRFQRILERLGLDRVPAPALVTA